MSYEERSRPAGENGTASTAADDYQYSGRIYSVAAAKSVIRRLCASPPASQEVPAQLERRRAAAHRSTRLDCGHRDPWLCRHDDDHELGGRA